MPKFDNKIERKIGKMELGEGEEDYLEELKDRLYIKQCILVSTADLYPRRARKLTNAGKERLRIAKNKILKENLQATVQGVQEVV